MMEKYNNNIINAYINGEDLGEYSIDDLENDKMFMMLVITRTNDKNYYDMCSLELKVNYEFISFLMKKFETDIPFICKIADYYLKKCDDETTRTELVIKMADLMEGKEDEKYHEYNIMRETFFLAKRVQIEEGKLNVNDEYTSSEIGMGFLWIFDSFHNNKIILNYFAKKMMESILEENNINLENMLYEQFDNLEELNKIGINNYLLKFIGTYDSVLASYLSTNIDLLDEFKNKICIIQERWNQYDNRNEQKKYNSVLEKVHEYMNQIEDEGILTETDLLYYVSQKLGVTDKLVKYDKAATDFDESFINDFDEEFLADTLKVSFIDQMHFNNVKKIISSTLFSNSSDVSEFDSSDDKNGKIMKIHFHNK